MNQILKKLPRKASDWRPWMQVLVFAGVALIPVGIFHMLCPFGGIETLGRIITQGKWVPKTGPGSLVLLAAVLVSTALAGPVFCGWICPLGSVQDWVQALARRTLHRWLPRLGRLRIPLTLDRILGWGRWAVLALIVWGTWTSFNLVFLAWDPYYALIHYWSEELAPTALAVLGAVLMLSLVVKRPWCRWFCPLGAVLGLVQRIAPFTLRFAPSACTSCRKCVRVCPVGIDPRSANDAMSLQALRDKHCIRCGLCADACPQPGTLCMAAPASKQAQDGPVAKGKPQKKSAAGSWLALGTALALLAVSLGLGLAGGRHSNQGAELHAGSGPARASSAQPLRSGMTLDEAAAARGLQASALLERLGLPAEYPLTTRLRDIEDDFEEKSYAWIRTVLEKDGPQP